MRSALEIEMGFREAIQKATAKFIGQKVTERIAGEVQIAVQEAAYDYYMDLSEAEIQAYDIRIPKPRTVINGHSISIENG